MSAIIRTLGVAATVCAIGCASGGLAQSEVSAEAPRTVVLAYLDALEHDSPERAYELLSKQRRQELSREQFLERWRQNRQILRESAAELRANLDHRVTLEARIKYGEGLLAPLVHDVPPAPEGWRLAEVPTPRLSRANSPEEALDTFRRAVEARDWDAISRLVSTQTREAVQRELTERVSGLSVARTIEISGDRARLRFGRYAIEFERAADGRWSVVGVK